MLVRGHKPNLPGFEDGAMLQTLVCDVEERISRLESSIRRDRAIVFGVLALLFATAQAPSPRAPGSSSTPIVVRDATGASATLSATGLTIRDKSGQARVFTGLDANGNPSVDLRDSSARLRESMYLLSELPVLRQFDTAGKRRAEMRLDSSNDGELLFYDQNDKLRMALYRATTGDPTLGLYGTDEKLRAYFATDDVSPFLVMRDANATTRVVVGGYKEGTMGMDIRDSSGNVSWKRP